MTRLFTLVISLFATPALAHVGHVGEVAGHGHWGGIILIGLAAAIGLWAAVKGKKDAGAKNEADADDAEEIDADPQEA